VECISKGKARQPYEFGVKASLAVTHKSGLIVGARTFPGNPYDGHVLNTQLEQVDVRPTQAVVDLGYRGVDADNPDVEILHRGRWKSLSRQQRCWVNVLRRSNLPLAIRRPITGWTAAGCKTPPATRCMRCCARWDSI